MKRLFFSALLIMTIFFFGTITANAAEIELGQHGEIAEQVIYWECSELGGSGRHNTVTMDNPYVPLNRDIIINGISYLNDDGYALDFSYATYEVLKDGTIPVEKIPEGTQTVMLHVCTPNTDLGWTNQDNIHLRVVEKSELTTSETEFGEQDSLGLAQMIQQYDGMTVVIVDRSSSMDKFAEDATKEFRTLNIDESKTKVYVFGRYFKEISAAQITDSNRDVRRGEKSYDYIDSVINEAAEKYNPKHIIVLSDLYVYDGSFVSQPELETLDILTPSILTERSKKVCEELEKAFPNTKVTCRQFSES